MDCCGGFDLSGVLGNRGDFLMIVVLYKIVELEYVPPHKTIDSDIDLMGAFKKYNDLLGKPIPSSAVGFRYIRDDIALIMEVWKDGKLDSSYSIKVPE